MYYLPGSSEICGGLQEVFLLFRMSLVFVNVRSVLMDCPRPFWKPLFKIARGVLIAQNRLGYHSSQKYTDGSSDIILVAMLVTVREFNMWRPVKGVLILQDESGFCQGWKCMDGSSDVILAAMFMSLTRTSDVLGEGELLEWWDHLGDGGGSLVIGLGEKRFLWKVGGMPGEDSAVTNQVGGLGSGTRDPLRLTIKLLLKFLELLLQLCQHIFKGVHGGRGGLGMVGKLGGGWFIGRGCLPGQCMDLQLASKMDIHVVLVESQPSLFNSSTIFINGDRIEMGFVQVKDGYHPADGLRCCLVTSDWDGWDLEGFALLGAILGCPGPCGRVRSKVGENEAGESRQGIMSLESAFGEGVEAFANADKCTGHGSDNVHWCLGGKSFPMGGWLWLWFKRHFPIIYYLLGSLVICRGP
ncbi:hypothetical protein EDC04DRAFT_2608035 [Pisolithus marmoratus]|nr:hypothetical protein EDC04DRAFT_2608035 [Pisolithus marmoratus]